MRTRTSEHGILLPDNFLVGLASAAHQTEGGNYNNCFGHYGHTYAPAHQDAGLACDSYNLYERDHTAVEQLNCNAYRTSLEWSRIEPEEGVFSEEETQHYIDVIDDQIRRGIEPIITIHHFTNPLWMEEQGGWKNPKSVEWFTRFVEYIVPRINGKIKIWLTFNEPNVMVQHKYMTGDWYPHEKRFVSPYFNVYPHLIQAHKNAYGIIKRHNSEAQVGITSNFAHVQPARNIYFPVNYYYQMLYSRFSNHYMYRNLKNEMDFIGLNFYTRVQISFAPLDALRGKPNIRLNPKPPETPDDMTFDAHAEDLIGVVQHLVNHYRLPVLVTENGYVSNDDQGRVEYLSDMHETLLRLIDDPVYGQMLLGYLHWTLMDNYEWHVGFGGKFGLFSLDDQFDLVPKASSLVYAQTAATVRARASAR